MEEGLANDIFAGPPQFDLDHMREPFITLPLPTTQLAYSGLYQSKLVRGMNMNP